MISIYLKKMANLKKMLNETRCSLNTISKIMQLYHYDESYINWITNILIIFLSLIDKYEMNIIHCNVDTYDDTYIGLFAIYRRLSGNWSRTPELPVNNCDKIFPWYRVYSDRFWNDIKMISNQNK